MSLWCCFVARVEINECGGCILKGKLNVTFEAPGCLSLRCCQYCEIQHCHFHICTSLEYIMETHWNPVEKQTLVLAIFSCISCLCTLWNANEVIALHCGFSDVLNQSNISLMSAAISVRLCSDAFYSQSNGRSYLCNSCAERTPSVEKKALWTDTVVVCLGVCSVVIKPSLMFVYFWYKLPCLSCLNIWRVILRVISPKLQSNWYMFSIKFVLTFFCNLHKETFSISNLIYCIFIVYCYKWLKYNIQCTVKVYIKTMLDVKAGGVRTTGTYTPGTIAITAPVLPAICIVCVLSNMYKRE